MTNNNQQPTINNDQQLNNQQLTINNDQQLNNQQLTIHNDQQQSTTNNLQSTIYQ
jgi:hypothetical protein